MAYASVDSENLGRIKNIRYRCLNEYPDDSCMEIPDEQFMEVFREAKYIRFYVASGADEYEEERPDLIANLEAAFISIIFILEENQISFQEPIATM